MKASELISLSEAAHHLGVSWNQMWRLALCREVAGEKIGGRWKVSRRDVERLAKTREYMATTV